MVAASAMPSFSIARASERVWLCAPAEAYPILAPALRRAQAQVPTVDLRSTGPVTLEFAQVGMLERIVSGKYREEFLKVQSGTLKDKFGIHLGYHYHLAGKPEALVFSTGLGSGIRCNRA